MNPTKHQARFRDEIAPAKPRYGLWHKQGTGKTATILFNERARPARTLVVAPITVIQTAWAKDSREIGVPFTSLYSKSRAKRVEGIRAICDPGVYAINPDQFRIHAKDLKAAGFDRFVFDESSKIKNRAAAITKAATDFADSVDEVYLLSGTPAPNCPTEYWSQLRTISAKATNGSFFGWANRWFYPINREYKGRSFIEKWLPKRDRQADFISYLAFWSWSLTKADCMDLPEQSDQVISVELSNEERAAYQLVLEGEVTDEIVAEILSGRISTKGLGILSKLRQIAGGVVLDNQGGEIALGSSKLDALREIAESIEGPLIVWAEYRHEIQRIGRVLRDMGRRVDLLYGPTSGDAGEIVGRFTRRETDAIVAHPQTAGHGIDGLQRVCSYAVYFSLSWSAELHEQSRDRIHRRGQTEPVTYIYLNSEDTLDDGIYKTVRSKCENSNAILESLRR